MKALTHTLLEEFHMLLNNGVDTDTFSCYNLKIESQIKHEDIYDKIIRVNNTHVQAISTNVIKEIKIWRTNMSLSGHIVLTKDNLKHTNSIEIKNKNYELSYECNSRKILKPCAEIINLINAHRNLAGTNKAKRNNNYYTKIPYSLLIGCCFLVAKNFDLVITLLEPYSTNNITKGLKDATFRHILKIVHPDTKIIKTPISTKDLALSA